MISLTVCGSAGLLRCGRTLHGANLPTVIGFPMLEIDSVVENNRAIQTTILICVTCRDPGDLIEAPRAGVALASATAAAVASDSNICIRRVECLANCSRGLSAALQREGAWTYVFGGLIASQDGETLATGARLLASSEDGLLPWAGRPAALKRGLVARVPPVQLERRSAE